MFLQMLQAAVNSNVSLYFTRLRSLTGFTQPLPEATQVIMIQEEGDFQWYCCLQAAQGTRGCKPLACHSRCSRHFHDSAAWVIILLWITPNKLTGWNHFFVLSLFTLSGMNRNRSARKRTEPAERKNSHRVIWPAHKLNTLAGCLCRRLG